MNRPKNRFVEDIAFGLNADDGRECHQQLTMDTIARWNNEGVDCVLFSEMSKAALCFHRAVEKARTITTSFFLPKALSLESLESCNKAQKDLGIYERVDYDEGMGNFSEPVRINGSMFSSVDDLTTTILFNVGIFYLRLNQEEAALSSFSEALKIARKQQSFTDNSKENNGQVSAENVRRTRTVAILHNIGWTQYRRGKYEDALQTYSQALRIGGAVCRQRFHHQSMFGFAATLNCLGVIHLHLLDADTDKAMDLFLESLALLRAISGSDHDSKQIATILNNIGRIRYLKGENDQALKAYSQALDMRRRLFGDDNLDVAATVYNVGQAHQQRNDLVEAMRFYNEFLVLGRKHIGVKRRNVANALKCIAEIYQSQKKYDKAQEFYQEALSAGKDALGLYHREIACTLNKLGNLCCEKGDLDRALHVYKEGLDVERKLLKALDPDRIVTLSNIAELYKVRREYKVALEFYDEVVMIQRYNLGKSHPDLASGLNSIAFIYCQTQRYNKALRVYHEVLRIQRQTHGADHLEVASTLHSIGLTFSEIDSQKFAIQYLQECLRIRQTLLGPFHQHVAIILNNIATIYHEQDDEDMALTYYRETLRVERVAENCEWSAVHTLGHIGSIHQERGEPEEAIQCFSEALHIQKATMANSSYGNQTDNNAAIGRTFNNLGDVYLQMGKVQNMMDSYSNSLRHYRLSGMGDNALVASGFLCYYLFKFHPKCAPVA